MNSSFTGKASALKSAPTISSQHFTWNGHLLPLFLSPKDIVEILNLSRSVVYELIASGQIPSIRVGRSVRVQTSDFVSWVADKKVYAA